MNERQREPPEKDSFMFTYVHPATRCPLSGDTQIRVQWGYDYLQARALAEQAPVICSNPTCGINYQLQ
jgi:hypothetical protein